MARILVIDDESDLLEMMRLVLEGRGGHEVILSAEGQDGLEKALSNPPDLAIIDVMMPGLTGYDICRQLRANPATASLPIIIMTARGQPMDRQAALDAGADEHLVKPVTMTEILEHVNAQLAQKTGHPVPHYVYVLMSLRGGVGVTTLAVNLALAWQQSGVSTCLLDFCQTSGHAALHLGLRPQPTWADLIQNDAATMDETSIQTHILQHESGLSVLASPFVPPTDHRLTPANAHRILKILQQRFTITIVDTSSILDEVMFTTLDLASAIGLVLAPEPAAIQTTMGTMRALAKWQEKFFLVLNLLKSGKDIPIQTLEKTLRHKLTAVIPFESDQARALTQGTPLTSKSPNSAWAQSIQAIREAVSQKAKRLDQNPTVGV
ncbi:MAG TPA: response regulator [Chloroflexi bacterium]|nr:response regulator [Chloroflexota bacterium]